MKSTVYYFILLLFLFASCRRVREPLPVPEEQTKLECLYRIRPDSVMKSYDLSNDSLTEFPDLSMYVISSLDLSHNLLDTIILERLPLGIERLNVSNNRLKGILEIYNRDIPTLKELDVSHNQLSVLVVFEGLYRLIASHNHLEAINFNTENAGYLDISYNPELSWEVDFNPREVDTIRRDGTANGIPFYFKISFQKDLYRLIKQGIEAGLYK